MSSSYIPRVSPRVLPDGHLRVGVLHDVDGVPEDAALVEDLRNLEAVSATRIRSPLRPSHEHNNLGPVDQRTHSLLCENIVLQKYINIVAIENRHLSIDIIGSNIAESM